MCRRRVFLCLLSLALSSMWVGCLNEPQRRCDTAQDCLQQEVCVEQICQPGASEPTDETFRGDKTTTVEPNQAEPAKEQPKAESLPKEPGKEPVAPDESNPTEPPAKEPALPEAGPESTPEPESIPEPETSPERSPELEPVPEPECAANATRPCHKKPSPPPTLGPCKMGTQTCTGGKWGTCEGDVYPDAETCNGKDDNCDGKTDESFPDKGKDCTPTGSTGCKEGKWTCVQGSKVCEPNKPVPETCNQKDDDCDGTVDNGFPLGLTCSAGFGLCRKTGVYTSCATDGKSAVCSAKPDLTQKKSNDPCNGFDDDCDGDVDEDGPFPCFAELGKVNKVSELILRKHKTSGLYSLVYDQSAAVLLRNSQDWRQVQKSVALTGNNLADSSLSFHPSGTYAVAVNQYTILHMKVESTGLTQEHVITNKTRWSVRDIAYIQDPNNQQAYLLVSDGGKQIRKINLGAKPTALPTANLYKTNGNNDRIEVQHGPARQWVFSWVRPLSELSSIDTSSTTWTENRSKMPDIPYNPRVGSSPPQGAFGQNVLPRSVLLRTGSGSTGPFSYDIDFRLYGFNGTQLASQTITTFATGLTAQIPYEKDRTTMAIDGSDNFFVVAMGTYLFRCDIQYKNNNKVMGVDSLKCSQLKPSISFDVNEYVHSLVMSLDGKVGAFVTRHRYSTSSDPRTFDGRLVVFRLK
ncbi:MAG: hypothetical protein EP343_14160 [Deltaproteobacteria bacterium]|nr:MAG: hypothetical protein EP343_14160 [Deltaproteobacteria bacterium]